ncbi:mitochondrial FAD-linked sulfhydryl oxidase [Nematocida sp. AWRm78]|nr:mitochondrial FAD-linked sulfhydryl oxidase [Nematocida sp. AWRm79]KAI5182338.1 mitochondrial FAD-linked sulfhydryl oxidase [Nematocida sp. AWRm78]
MNIFSQGKEKPGLSQKEKAEVGRSTWNLLHAIARRYPDTPSKKEQKAVYDLFESLHILYPCKPCASSISAFKNSNLLRTQSRSSLIFSFCEFHNWINIKLNKPRIDCATFTEAELNPGITQNSHSKFISTIKTRIISVIHQIKSIL